jgi:hypothetical protein
MGLHTLLSGEHVVMEELQGAEVNTECAPYVMGVPLLVSSRSGGESVKVVRGGRSGKPVSEDVYSGELSGVKHLESI